MGFYRFQTALNCVGNKAAHPCLLGEHLGWQESAGIAVIVAAGILSSLKARN